MTIKKRFLDSLAVIGILAMLVMPFIGCGNKVIQSGYTWEITETIKLKSLAIAEDAYIIAPKGYNVIMMVNGAEKPIKPGLYTGEIMLKVVKTV
jgi:hypothetical protein